MQMIVDGITVVVTKKNMKSLRLRVMSDGQVRLSAPYCVSEKAIREFIGSNATKIRRLQDAASSRGDFFDPSLKNGSDFYFFGERYTLKTVHGSANTLKAADGQALLTLSPKATDDSAKEFVNQWYRERLNERIALLLPVLEEKTGLRCSSLQIKRMTTRWGTCNTKTKKLWINLHLAKMPPVCLEYVLLHELSHTREAGHGQAFKNILDTYMPERKSAEKLLRDFPENRRSPDN